MRIATRLAIVAQEQGFFRSGLAEMLTRDVGFARVLTATSLAEVHRTLADNSAADLLALDLAIAGPNGCEAIRDLRTRYPSLRIAVVAARPDRLDILSCLAAGAHAYIAKSDSEEDVRHALLTVQHGDVFVPASLAEFDGHAPGRSPGGDAFAGLTGRQLQVMGLLSKGCPNKVIARHLGISPSTVKAHVHAAFRALGVHNRTGAVAALHSTHPGAR